MIGISCTVAAVVAVLIGLMLAGYFGGVGPFAQLKKKVDGKLPGNGPEYDLSYVVPLSSSPLAGKNICFLGSSVTCGAASGGVSFVEYLSKRNCFTYVKEAVGGTTLVDSGKDSYVSRLKNIDKSNCFDLFICQLSTNDASKKTPLGTPSDVTPDTVCGAVNYIISYVEETWRCPVVFYSNPRYDSEEYQKMVDNLRLIAADKQIILIDLYNNDDFNDITQEERKHYMADNVHPTRAGYLKWWTPEMEKVLYEMCIL